MSDPLETPATDKTPALNDDTTDGESSWLPSFTSDGTAWSISDLNPMKVLDAPIKKYFGRSYDPLKLVRVITALTTGQTVDDEDMIDVIEMGIYYMRNNKGWVIAPDNLEYYLIAGQFPISTTITDPKKSGLPVKYMDGKSVFSGHTLTTEFLCDFEFYTKIRDGMVSRLTAHKNSMFPASGSSVTGKDGNQIPVTPISAETWQKGHRGMMYAEDDIILGGSEDDIFNALGTAGFVVGADVETQELEDGSGWKIIIHSYEVWGWDKYDWHSGLDVTIQLKMLSDLGTELSEYISSYLRSKNIDPSILEAFKIKDTWLKGLGGKTINHSNGKTYYPAPYLILITPWEIDLDSAPCNRESTFIQSR